MKKRLKINGLIMAVSIVAAFSFPGVFFRKASLSPTTQILKISGLMLILFGQLFRASARGFKAAHSKQGAVLIQEGPYSFVRNPMYLGIVLIGLGVVVMLFQWWVASVFLLVFAVRYIALTQEEEKRLLALFSGAYQAYCRKVPRLIPSVQSILKREVSEYLPLELPWIIKETGSAVALLLATLLVEAWFDSKALGMKLYLLEAIARVGVIFLFMLFLGWLLLRHSRTATKNGYVST